MGMNDDLGIDTDPSITPPPTDDVHKALTDSNQINVLIDTSIDDDKSKEKMDLIFTQSAVLGQLPNIEADFKTLKDSADDLSNIGNAKEQLLVEGAISQESAKFLNEVAPGLLNDSLSLEEFSKLPTLVNFNIASNYMDSVFDAKTNTTKEASTKFFLGISEYISKLSENIDTVAMPFINEAYYNLSKDHFSVMRNRVSMANSVLPMKDRTFLNLYETPLTKVEIDNIDFDQIDDFFGMTKEEFKNTVKSLKVLLDNLTLSIYIRSLCKGGDDFYGKNTDIAIVKSQGLSLSDLRYFFAEFFDKDNKLQVYIENLRVSKAFFDARADMVKESTKDLCQFIASDSEKVSSTLDELTFINTLFQRLPLLVQTSHHFFTILYKMNS